MASAYTPGLAVREGATIARTRRLPLRGRVLVAVGDTVLPHSVVARADLPGLMLPTKVAAQTGLDPADVPGACLVQVGDTVTRGQVVARTKGLWGRFRAEARAGATGTVEIISPVTGSIGIREAPTPLDVNAYIPGTITDILPGEGATVASRGAWVQGIFGVGGERQAPLHILPAPDSIIGADDISPTMRGCLVAGGSCLTGAGLARAVEVGVLGIVVGGIVDTDLTAFLGYDIGVAITGQENIPLTLILTEGFGQIPMASRTYDLLASRHGQAASFSGATQIRAGVIRPEIIIADASGTASLSSAISDGGGELTVGAKVRLIREPYFGLLATVTQLPSPLVRLESGTQVRVLYARLPDGAEVVVPRANVEMV